MDVISDLSKIRSLVDDAIRKAFSTDIYSFSHEAIDWGKLKCLDVCPGAYPNYRVYIQGVEPDCHDFQSFISTYLTDHGFPNVEVEMEWRDENS